MVTSRSGEEYKALAAVNGSYFDGKLMPSFKLEGLSDDMEYSIRELNVDKSCFWGDGKTFSGSFLKNFGINPEIPKLYSSAVFYLEAR